MRLPIMFLICTLLGSTASAQVKNFTPVTRETMLNPSPDDWLMMSRTYDEQRFSPLRQINKQNVSKLQVAWSRGLTPGIHEHIPLVHQGVMYVANPGGLEALDATNGDLLWEYKQKMPGRVGRTMAIFEDLIIYAPPDRTLTALDAKTGQVRWQAPTGAGVSSSGPKVIDGKVIAGIQAAAGGRASILCLDARTGKQLWRFYTGHRAGSKFLYNLLPCGRAFRDFLNIQEVQRQPGGLQLLIVTSDAVPVQNGTRLRHLR